MQAPHYGKYKWIVADLGICKGGFKDCARANNNTSQLGLAHAVVDMQRNAIIIIVKCSYSRFKDKDLI